jgi:hypothetical protein
MTRASQERVAKRATKKTAKKASNGAVKANGAKANGANGSGIPLTEAQKETLGAIDGSMVRKKVNLANTILRLDAAEVDKNRLMREIKSEGQEFEAATREICKEHGIDPDGNERWRLELKTMELHRSA